MDREALEDYWWYDEADDWGDDAPRTRAEALENERW